MQGKAHALIYDISLDIRKWVGRDQADHEGFYARPSFELQRTVKVALIEICIVNLSAPNYAIPSE